MVILNSPCMTTFDLRVWMMLNYTNWNHIMPLFTKGVEVTLSNYIRPIFWDYWICLENILTAFDKPGLVWEQKTSISMMKNLTDWLVLQLKKSYVQWLWLMIRKQLMRCSLIHNLWNIVLTLWSESPVAMDFCPQTDKDKNSLVYWQLVVNLSMNDVCLCGDLHWVQLALALLEPFER